MRKSVLIIKSLLLMSLICFTFFNLNLILHAQSYRCENEGAPDCYDEAWDYCFDYCDSLEKDCDDWYFLSGECGCSAVCIQQWKVTCVTGGEDIYECETYWGNCPWK